MAEEGTPPASAELLAELGAMKMRALQRRAEELGVEDEKLEDAEEKSAVIALIVARLDEQAAEAKRIATLRDELVGMKMRALQRRAEELGVEDEKLEEAEEKSEVIALIMAAMPAPSAAIDADEKATKLEAARLARLRDELDGLKLRALQRRAAELGVDDDALDAAEEKSSVIDLIMAKEKESRDGASIADIMTADVCSSSDSHGAHSAPAHNTEAKAESMVDIFAQWKEQGLHVMFS